MKLMDMNGSDDPAEWKMKGKAIEVPGSKNLYWRGGPVFGLICQD